MKHLQSLLLRFSGRMGKIGDTRLSLVSSNGQKFENLTRDKLRSPYLRKNIFLVFYFLYFFSSFFQPLGVSPFKWMETNLPSHPVASVIPKKILKCQVLLLCTFKSWKFLRPCIKILNFPLLLMLPLWMLLKKSIDE